MHIRSPCVRRGPAGLEVYLARWKLPLGLGLGSGWFGLGLGQIIQHVLVLGPLTRLGLGLGLPWVELAFGSDYSACLSPRTIDSVSVRIRVVKIRVRVRVKVRW
eukprot:1321005-Amorphochlora_amoeboformis.AAC.1